MDWGKCTCDRDMTWEVVGYMLGTLLARGEGMPAGREQNGTGKVGELLSGGEGWPGCAG